MSLDPIASEIAELLDQCSPEELTNILATIEKDGNSGIAPLELAQQEVGEQSAVAAPVPVPPAAPPPVGSGRRPVPAGVRKGQLAADDGAQAGEPNLTMNEIKHLLEEHSALVISEVQQMLPKGGQGITPDQFDIASLTQALADRDMEAQTLEQKLAALQEDLVVKDQRVLELGNELNQVVRETRHRQLDLEFQQLKLQEKVRSNAELERSKQHLEAQVEEINLNARHAALDADLSVASPRSICVQGSLPWTLRSQRAPAVGYTALTPR